MSKLIKSELKDLITKASCSISTKPWYENSKVTVDTKEIIDLVQVAFHDEEFCKFNVECLIESLNRSTTQKEMSGEEFITIIFDEKALEDTYKNYTEAKSSWNWQKTAMVVIAVATVTAGGYLAYRRYFKVEEPIDTPEVTDEISNTSDAATAVAA